MQPGQQSRAEYRSLNRLLHLSGAGIAAGALALVLSVLYRPAYSERQDIDRQIARVEGFLEQEEAVHAESRLLQNRLEETERVLHDAIDQVPEDSDVSEFLAQLSQLGTRSGLLVREFRPGTSIGFDRYSELPVNVTAAGSYAGLCRFLDGLEGMPRLCQVRSLTISESSGPDGQYPVSMSLVIYSAPMASADNTQGEAAHE